MPTTMTDKQFEAAEQMARALEPFINIHYGLSLADQGRRIVHEPIRVEDLEEAIRTRETWGHANHR